MKLKWRIPLIFFVTFFVTGLASFLFIRFVLIADSPLFKQKEYLEIIHEMLPYLRELLIFILVMYSFIFCRFIFNS